MGENVMKRNLIVASIALAVIIGIVFLANPGAVAQTAAYARDVVQWLNKSTDSTNSSLQVSIVSTDSNQTIGGDLTVTGDTTLNGWFETPPIIVAAQSYTVTSAGKAADYIVEWSDTAVYDFTLPASMSDGTEITVCDGDLNAATNNGTVYPSGTDTIQETTSFVQNANGECETFKYILANTDWTIKAGYLE
jgi:hypothetical protein